MEIAAFAISVVALLGAAWSAWATHRQAIASEAQASAAKASNALAREALELARAAEAREQSRQEIEDRPAFEVVGRRRRHSPGLMDLTVKNGGPLAYDAVLVTPDYDDAETNRLVRGMQHADALVHEVDLGAVRPGESLAAALVRTNPELGGAAKLKVRVTRQGRIWETIHYLKLARPSRITVS